MTTALLVGTTKARSGTARRAKPNPTARCRTAEAKTMLATAPADPRVMAALTMTSPPSSVHHGRPYRTGVRGVSEARDRSSVEKGSRRRVLECTQGGGQRLEDPGIQG